MIKTEIESHMDVNLETILRIETNRDKSDGQKVSIFRAFLILHFH